MDIENTAWALFEAHRSGVAKLTGKAGSFVGQLVADPRQSLTDRQAEWLGKLIERAGLPPLEQEA